MEKLNFLQNGVIRLPPGFRFHPTDEELVLQYLKRKVFSCPLPASIIPEVDVCKSDPWDLPGEKEQERYFFSTREAKYPNGSRSNRATSSGYWKGTGIDKQIVASKTHQVVGMKKTLVFYQGKPPHGCRTDWVMHEYRLASSDPKVERLLVNMEDWVLCRIFLKKRSSKCEDDYICQQVERSNSRPQKRKIAAAEPVFYDFMTKDTTKTALSLGPSSSFSGSSGITQASSKESEEDREESSSCNSLASASFRKKQP